MKNSRGDVSQELYWDAIRRKADHIIKVWEKN